MTILDVTIRSATLEDMPYVYDTWLKSYCESEVFTLIRQGNRNAQEPFCDLKKELFFRPHRRRIQQLESAGRLIVRVAQRAPAGPDDPLLGWEAHDGASSALHFVYVRQAFRQKGIACQLLRSWPIDRLAVTHLTPDFLRAFSKETYMYHPYAFWVDP